MALSIGMGARILQSSRPYNPGCTTPLCIKVWPLHELHTPLWTLNHFWATSNIPQGKTLWLGAALDCLGPDKHSLCLSSTGIIFFTKLFKVQVVTPQGPSQTVRVECNSPGYFPELSRFTQTPVQPVFNGTSSETVLNTFDFLRLFLSIYLSI